MWARFSWFVLSLAVRLWRLQCQNSVLCQRRLYTQHVILARQTELSHEMALDAAVLMSVVLWFMFAFDDNYMTKSFYRDFVWLETVDVDHRCEASRVEFVWAWIGTVTGVGSRQGPGSFESFCRYQRKSFHLRRVCKKWRKMLSFQQSRNFFLLQLTVILKWSLENIASVRQVGHSQVSFEWVFSE